MDTPAALVETIRTCLHALHTADPGLLSTVAEPHPALASLTNSRPSQFDAASLATDLSDLQVSIQHRDGERAFVHAYFRGLVQPLIAVSRHGVWRLDMRWSLAAGRPETDQTRTARAFLLAMLLGDLEKLTELAVHPGGLELLVENPPPAGESDQLIHVVEQLSLVELGLGDDFPNLIGGRETVTKQHVDAGIAILLGLFAGGELPFLMKQLDGAWRVVPAPFVRAAVLARGGTIG